MHSSRIILTAVVTSLTLHAAARAGGNQELETVVVTARKIAEVGVADSANVGTVTREQLAARTVYRPGELLETTPGLIVSQHSGEGKANQFYLRGFNLDHGTDLRTTVDGMLVNQRTHSHGHGWTDLNFVIPELTAVLEYKKGPYYAEEGDFSSAGAVSLKYVNELPQGIAELGGGQNGYRRILVADSAPLAEGHLLYALEAMHNDGPFVHPDNYRKLNGVLRYSRGDAANGFNVTAMGYDGNWNATDQIAQRAIVSGDITGRFDAIDPTDGGSAHRYSLSSAWKHTTETSSSHVNAYLIDSKLRLFSDFTYFLDDPVNMDQFHQPDKRTMTALNADHTWKTPLGSLASETTVGVQLQNDNIFNALYHTKAREILSTTRADHTVETSVGVLVQNSTKWNDKFRTVIGLRDDRYRSKVVSDNPLNSGDITRNLASPKLALIFGPWAQTEYYVNLGGGFHSNDARGTTISVDPKTGLTADRVAPLVRSKGFEVGIRTSIIQGLQTSVALYNLDFDSELIFQGDAGTTAAGRPSRRNGFELANYYKLREWLTIDADIAYARARFRDQDLVGERIPGAVEGVASFAIAFDHLGPYFGGLQWRYFGPRPLIEDNSVRSHATAVFNGRIGYKFSRAVRAELEGFNLTDRKVSAIDYYYTSRLPGEPADGVNDTHFHPIESRSFRLAIGVNF